MRKLATTFIFALVATFNAWAAEPFTEAAFKEAQANDGLVLVDIKASWCPTCAKQEKILKAYQKKYPESKITMLAVDYDDQKKWVKHFKAPRQSTLALYKGEERVWFSVAETRKKVIFSALQKAEVN